MDEKHFPSLGPVSRRTIDLKVIEKQLDTIEQALMLAYRRLYYDYRAMPEDVGRVQEAIDTLLAIKQSFGMTSLVKPVLERQSAIVEDKRTGEG